MTLRAHPHRARDRRRLSRNREHAGLMEPGQLDLGYLLITAGA